MMETAIVPGARVTLNGLRDTPGPEGETVAVTLTAPEKLFRLVRVIVELPEEPARTSSEDGLEYMAKSSSTVTVTDKLVV